MGRSGLSRFGQTHLGDWRCTTGCRGLQLWPLDAGTLLYQQNYIRQVLASGILLPHLQGAFDQDTYILSLGRRRKLGSSSCQFLDSTIHILRNFADFFISGSPQSSNVFLYKVSGTRQLQRSVASMWHLSSWEIQSPISLRTSR